MTLDPDTDLVALRRAYAACGCLIAESLTLRRTEAATDGSSYTRELTQVWRPPLWDLPAANPGAEAP